MNWWRELGFSTKAPTGGSILTNSESCQPLPLGMAPAARHLISPEKLSRPGSTVAWVLPKDCNVPFLSEGALVHFSSCSGMASAWTAPSSADLLVALVSISQFPLKGWHQINSLSHSSFCCYAGKASEGMRKLQRFSFILTLHTPSSSMYAALSTAFTWNYFLHSCAFSLDFVHDAVL